MKKIMIALTAVALAASVQASSVGWWAGALVYNDASETYVTAPSMWLIALNGGSASDISVADGGVLTIGEAMKSVYGEAIALDDAWSANGSLEEQSPSNNGDAYALVVWDGKDSANGGKFDVYAGTVAGIADDPPTDGEMSFVQSYSLIHEEDVNYLTQNVVGEPTPEPTSGLLLLLGVAGFALRRKQK